MRTQLPLWTICFACDEVYVPIILTTIPIPIPRIRHTELDLELESTRLLLHEQHNGYYIFRRCDNLETMKILYCKKEGGMNE